MTRVWVRYTSGHRALVSREEHALGDGRPVDDGVAEVLARDLERRGGVVRLERLLAPTELFGRPLR